MTSTIVAQPSATVAPAVPRVAPIAGAQARVGAKIQGEQWTARLDVRAGREHAEAFTSIDRRGDEIRRRIWRHEDAAISALRGGRISEALAELLAGQALREKYEECDAHEADHVVEVAGYGEHADGALERAGALTAKLLGQKGPGLTLADRLLAGTMPEQCGRLRADSGGVAFHPCPKLAGHVARGEVCVFVAIPNAPAALP